VSQSVHIISTYFRKRFAFESQYGLNRSLQNLQCKNFNIIWFNFALNVSRVITFYTMYKRIFAIKGFMKLCHAKCGKKITLLPPIFLYCKFAYFSLFFCSKQILSSKLGLLRYVFYILFHCWIVCFSFLTIQNHFNFLTHLHCNITLSSNYHVWSW